MLLLFVSLLATALANPIVPEAPAIPPVDGGNVLASYQYALDYSQAASLSQCQCLRSSGYSTVFVRAYTPANGGTFDNNACPNIQNAYNAGLGTEVYMTPQINSNKQGYQQVDEVYNGLTKSGITVRTIWVQVVSPVNWSTQTNNINFISSMLSRIRQYGMNIGIYTSLYDWNQITNGWTGAGSDTMLWYWNVNGGGVNGETQPNFNDFNRFGCWNSPTVKQFAQTESVCSITVNRDVYMGSSVASLMAKKESEGPVVGETFAH